MPEESKGNRMWNKTRELKGAFQVVIVRHNDHARDRAEHLAKELFGAQSKCFCLKYTVFTTVSSALR